MYGTTNLPGATMLSATTAECDEMTQGPTAGFIWPASRYSIFKHRGDSSKKNFLV